MVMRATARREQTGEGELVLLGNGRTEVTWGLGAELRLFEHAGVRTRVVGGPLIELMDPTQGRRPFSVGMGRDRDQDFATDPVAVEDVHGAGLLARRRFPVAGQQLTAELDIIVYDAHPWVSLALRVTNHGAEPAVLSRLFPFVAGLAWGEEPLTLGERVSDFAVYKQGWQSWSFTGGLPPGAADPRPRAYTAALWHSPAGDAPREPLGDPVDVVSEGMVLIGRTGEHPALLAGFLGAERHFGQLYVDRARGSLTAAVLLDQLALGPGETVESDPLLLAAGAPDALLDLYAAALARAQGARPSSTPLSGWCSWYYYFTRVTEADILESVAALRSARGKLPLEVVQIDDGYQQAVGDWLDVNEKFPSGMAALAQRIRDSGFRPGLWLAPFTLAANSRLAAEHPEWLVHDERGRPSDAGTNWDTTLHALDTTHPGTREWLRRLFGTIVEQWGYDYLKLDFLVTAAVPGQRWAPAISRAAALRQGLELIRAAVGNEVYLVGCGCPLLSAVGLVDAMRIGPDVTTAWSPHPGLALLSPGDAYAQPSLEGALRNSLLRAWTHPMLWTNDPDCLLARDAESDLTPHEVRALATVIGLTGGMMVLSDRVAHLTLDRLDLAAHLLPPLRERALPSSYLESGIPERAIARVTRPWGSWLLVGLFNPTGTTREMRVRWDELRIEPGAYHATEFWSGSYLGASTQDTAVSVPPHGAAVLALHAVGSEPQLLSTSFHISQGGAEVASWGYEHESRRLRWAAALGRRASGTFMLWLPDALTPRRLVSTAHAVHWRRHAAAAGVVLVEAEVDGQADFALELE
jgi:alpha-galactosidase